MAAVNAPHGGRLRSVFAVGFATGAALVAALVLGVARVQPSAFVVYLMLLGGVMGSLVLVSAAAAIGVAHIHDRRSCTLVVSGLGASIASVGVGYLLVAHPPGNHLGAVGLATLLGAGGWGAWQAHRGILDRTGVVAGLFLSVVVTVGLFAVTWAVGVIFTLAGI